MADGDYKVVVGVDVNFGELNKLKTEIKNLSANRKPIKINIDADTAHKKITNLKKHIQTLGTTTINLNGATGMETSLNRIANSIDEIKVSLSALGNVSGLQNMTTAATKAGNAFSGGANNVRQFANAIEDINLSHSKKQIENLEAAMDELKFNSKFKEDFVKDLKEIGLQIDKITTKANDDGSITFTVKGTDQLGRAVTAVKKVREVIDEDGTFKLEVTGSQQVVQKFNQIDQAATKAQKRFDDIKFKFDTGKLTKDLNEVERDFRQLRSATDDAHTANQRFSDAHTALCAALNEQEVDINKVIAANKEYETALKQVKNQIDINKMAQQKADDAARLASDKISLEQDIRVWMKKNSAATEQFGGKLREIISQIERCDRAQLSRLRSEFRHTTKEAERLGKTGLNFGDSLKQKFRQYASYFAASFSIMEVVQGLRYMAEAVLEVDTAMTGLRRVTDLTAAQYDVLYDKMIGSAKEYGATLTDIINATSDWVRAGFDSDVAVGLAEITTMYQHISDLDYDTAAENLITAYNGFKQELLGLYDGDEVAAVGYIADVFNELDNNFAVTSAGLGEALTRSASALDLAGNSIQESAAMVTGITEVTQDPEKAGSALKILSLRLRGMKGQLEEIEAGASEGVESISKMQTQILNMTDGSVNIFNDDGSFKSTYDIMSGIAEIWDDLSSIDQAELLETIAGKHRANDVAALISNWDNVKSAMQSALDAEGSAAEENAKYVDSLQGRLDKLTAAWQAFANTFMSSDFLKGAVSALTEFVELIELLVKHLGTLGTIGLGVGIFGLFKKRGGIVDHFKNLSTTLADVTTATGTLGTAAKSTGKAMLSSFVKSPMAAATAIGLVTAAISLAVTAYKNYKEEQARIRQETIDTSNAFLDSASSFEQAYVKYSGRTNLTSEEEAELEAAIQGTVDALDDKSSKLQKVVDGSSDYVRSLEQIKEAELEAAKFAADEKKNAAKKELEESAMGWERFDGSEVDIEFDSFDTSEASSEAKKIAQEVGSEYIETLYNSEKEGMSAKGFKLSGEASVDEIIDYYYMLKEYQERLLDADLGETAEYEKATTAINKMTEAVGLYVDGVYDAAKSEYQLANGIPKTTEEYLKMREAILADSGDSVETRKIVASTLHSEYGQLFDLTSAEAQSRKLIGIIDGFGDEQAGQFEMFLNMRTAVNNGECTVGEYMSSFSDIEDMVDDFDSKTEEEIKLAFGLDADTVKEQYDDLVDDLTQYMGSDGAKKFLGDLTASELSATVRLSDEGELDWEGLGIEELKDRIKSEAEYLMAMEFTIDIEGETKGIEAFNTALAESRSATGLTADSLNALQNRYQGLASYDAATLFQETANGISLNADALRECESEYNKLQLEDTTQNLGALEEKYYDLTDSIAKETDATKKSQMVRERDDIRAKITELAELASMYEGLTSSYNEWQNAEAAGNDRDMYANVHSAMEGVDKELELGWIDDGTTEFFQLIWGEDKWSSAGKSVSDYRKKWNTLDDTIKGTSYSILDFWKTNEDGELTSQGVFNFFKAVKQVQGNNDWVQTDKDGNLTSFNFGVNGDAAIAEALGISEELVQIFLRAAQDCGFVVNFDGTYTQLADLQNEAIAATNAFNEMFGKNYTFDFDSTSIKSLTDDLNEAKQMLENEDFWNHDESGNRTSFNFDAKGAKEAMTVVSTLQATIDSMNNKYIGLTTDNESFEEPLEKLQDYESKVDYLNQLKLDQEVNADEITALEEELDGILDYFEEIQESNPELAAELKIEGLSREEIQKKIEAGEIEIPATLDLQMDMNENIEDLVKLALYNSGMLTDEEKLEIEQEFKLKYIESDESEGADEINSKAQEDAEAAGQNPVTVDQEFELNPVFGGSNNVMALSDILRDYTTEEQQVVLKFLADPTDLENYQPEEKEAMVKFIADSIDVDGYTPEEKEAYAKYLVDGGDVTAYTPEEKEAIATYLVNGGDIDSYSPEDKDAIVKFLANTGEVDNYTPEQKQAIAKFIKDSMEVDTYQMPTDKWAWARYLKDTHDIDIWTPPLKTGGEAEYSPYINDSTPPPLYGGYAYYKAVIKADGSAHSDGTAFADGTVGRAFKNGDWRVKDNGVALGGELGQEVVVRDGRYFTIGDKGAEFFKYEKDDIIFNAKQTEQLFKYGRIINGKTRGRALASGTAFANGSVPSSGLAFSHGTGADEPTYPSSPSKSSSKSSSSSDAADEFEETLDWIEIAIDRIERAISRLDLTANSIYKKWSTRNEALADEIGKVNEEINLQQAAYNRYMQEAKSVGLSSSWMKKVQDGKVDIETITDEDLANKIKEYQEWYEKALDCKDAIAELKEQEAELYMQRFENVAKEYENMLSIIEHEKNMLDEYINQSEAHGWIVSTKYYDALAKNERESIAKLQQEKQALLSSMQEAVASGAIEKESEAWYEMVNQIDEVTLAIAEGETALLEYIQAIREIEWEVFDLLQGRISNLASEADFLIELLSSDKLYDDNGQFTNEGMSTMGLHGVNYNVYMAQADKYAKELLDINKELAKDPYNQELVDRRQELLDLQQESILAAEDEKNAIRDMVEEGIELELDALQERIDKYNEALETQKDMYDYQKKVAEQTKEIASLEKQMAAYAGDDSEEAKAKIQELKVSLEEAKADLEETEYDRYISDQEQLLDSLYEEYETILNQRLDNIDALIVDMIDAINNNADTISTTLNDNAESVGYDMTGYMDGVWDTSGNIKDVASVYGDGTATTVGEAIKKMDKDIADMIEYVDKQASANISYAASSSAAYAPENNKVSGSATNTKVDGVTPSMIQSNKNETKKDTTIKVGDTINAGNAKIYADSYGGGGGKQYFSDPVYTVVGERGDYVLVSHADGNSGATGWFKKSDVIKEYASGKRSFWEDEIAWTQENGREFIVRPSDGAILTPIAKGDSVLSAAASQNIWDMANNPADFIKENLNLGTVDFNNNSGTQTIYTQNLDNVVFSFPNVRNYEEILNSLRKDRNFERLLKAMTFDQMVGGSSLAKGKSIR